MSQYYICDTLASTVESYRGCVKIGAAPFLTSCKKTKQSPDFPKPGLCHVKKNVT